MSNDENIFDDFDFIIAVVMMSVNWFLLMAACVNMQREEYHSIMLEGRLLDDEVDDMMCCLKKK